MQIRLSVSALTGPGPDTDRLCRVSVMSETRCARAPGTSPSAISPTNAAASQRALDRGSGRRRGIVPGDPEDLDPPVVRVAHIELVLVADEGSGGQPELAGVRSALAQGQQEVA